MLFSFKGGFSARFLKKMEGWNHSIFQPEGLIVDPEAHV